MLLIPDIHINSRYADKILGNILSFIDENPQEQNVIFLGDYVYHFSYDRKSLLALFDLFLTLYKKGKNVYILAGNHDWIAEEFVFQEGKKTIDLLGDLIGNNVIKFITQPCCANIEGEDILFLPYNVNLSDDILQKNIKYDKSVSQLEKIILSLKLSKNKNEQYSAIINDIVAKYISQKQPSKKLFVFHHYYFADTFFPGQKSRFSYKDVALWDGFLDLEDVFFVSGHVHKSFCFKNYLCVGSAWNSSPLEQNEFKCLYKMDAGNLKFWAKSFFVNPYFLIEYKDDLFVDEGFLQKNIQNIFDKFKENFTKSAFLGQFFLSNPKTSEINLFLKSNNLDYDNLQQKIDQSLINQLGDIKIKKENMSFSNAFLGLDNAQKDLQNNISDWRKLLQEYIIQKFPKQKELYFEKLKELNLL